MNALAQLHMQASLNGTYADMLPNQDSEANLKSGLNQYKRQIVAMRTILYHKRALQMVTGDNKEQREARRASVLRRVTREFWTNFVAKGEDTAMLRHLQEKLKAEFGSDLQFYYPPGDVEMIILHDGKNGPEPVEKGMHAAIINRAWQIARDLVASHMA